MDFSKALESIKDNRRMQRSGWNGKGMYVALFTPSKNAETVLPYIYMKTANNKIVPWLASQTDLMSNDWQEYKQ